MKMYLLESLRDVAKSKMKHKKHEKGESKKHEKKEHAKKHLKKEKDSVKEAMRHPDKLGAGAKKRKKLPAKEKVGVVMKEFKRGTLNSGSGQKVTNPKQAIAIALSEAKLSKKKKPKAKKKK